MEPGDRYRLKSIELMAEARAVEDLFRRMELEGLALSYMRLADQAECNAKNDVVYEPPLDRPVVQQQQQPQTGINASDQDDRSAD